MPVTPSEMRQGRYARRTLLRMHQEDHHVRLAVAHPLLDQKQSAWRSPARASASCTDTYVKNKPKIVRGGKLISQAK